MQLSDILDLEVWRRAKPDVVTGHHLLDRDVRWVHTSELAEAASLLKGGEILLTTGLGLAGRGPVAQQTYVSQLADRGVLALALDLGWTFEAVPAPLAEAAKRRDLVFIALRELVPFVELTEAAQSALIHESFTGLRLRHDVDQILYELLEQGQGAPALVSALSEQLDCAVLLEAPGGQFVACAGLGEATAITTLEDGRTEDVEVRVRGQAWGWLHFVDCPETHSQLLVAAKRSASSALAIALLNEQQSPAVRGRRYRREFLSSLVEGSFGSRGDLLGQATLVGLNLPSDGSVVGFAVGGFNTEDAAAAVQAAEVAASEHRGLAGDVNGRVVGLFDARGMNDGQRLAEALLHKIDETMRRRGALSRARVALGPVVNGLESVGASLRAAQTTLRLAEDLQAVSRAVTSHGMGADRLLGQILDDPVLAQVIDEQIGPLVQYDDARGSDLVQTLWVYLLHGSAKSGAAAALHIRRQTLYKRVVKIADLLGDVEDPERRLSLLMALRAEAMTASRPRQRRRSAAAS